MISAISHKHGGYNLTSNAMEFAKVWMDTSKGGQYT